MTDRKGVILRSVQWELIAQALDLIANQHIRSALLENSDEARRQVNRDVKGINVVKTSILEQLRKT